MGHMKPTPGALVAIVALLLGFMLLILLAIISMNGGENSHPTGWMTRVDGPVRDIVTGDNGTIYAFAGNTSNKVYAFDSNGTLEWEYDIPDAWRVRNVFPYMNQLSASSMSAMATTYTNDPSQARYLTGISYFQTKLVCAVDLGVLYLYVRENRTTCWNHGLNEYYPQQPQEGDWNLSERLLALAANGTLLWDVPLGDEHHVYEDTDVIAKGGRVYVFDHYAVTVLEDSGKTLFRLDNVSGRPAVDDDGSIYIVPAAPADPQPPGLTQYYHDPGIEVPSNVIESYDARGNISWRTDIGGQVWLPGFSTLPLYQNGTLWVPLASGLQAFDTSGRSRWAKTYEVTANWPIWSGYVGLFEYMPVDSYNNAYVYAEGPGDPLASKKWYYVIADNGSETIRSGLPYVAQTDPAKGLLIDTAPVFPARSTSAGGATSREGESAQMLDAGLTIYDIIGNRTLWGYTVTPTMNTTVLTDQNFYALLSDKFEYVNASPGIFVWGYDLLSIAPGDHVLFVAYHWAYYDYPIVPGSSQCYYASKILAFDDRKGTLFWEMPLDALITTMTARNDTIYYGTGDGRLYARQVKA
jgi:hypothetical protein